MSSVFELTVFPCRSPWPLVGLGLLLTKATSELIGCSYPRRGSIEPGAGRTPPPSRPSSRGACGPPHHICGPVSFTCLCVCWVPLSCAALRRARARARLTSLCARVSCSALPLLQCTSHLPSPCRIPSFLKRDALR